MDYYKIKTADGLNFNGLTVIVGLGASGLACTRYLAKLGFEVAVNDSRQEPPGLSVLRQEFPHIPVSLGHFDKNLLNQAQQLIVSPGVSLKQPEIAEQIARGIEVIGDIELFARLNKTPVIAITGSNGKTTVTTLVGKMVEAAGLKAGVGGNIGRPVLEMLDLNVDYYVLELSSFQLETTFSLKTQAATILNISPDHMDRYDHYDEYRLAKQRIYLNCQRPVINLDQPDIWNTIDFAANPVSFGLNKRADYGLDQHSSQNLKHSESVHININNAKAQYLCYQGNPILAVHELPLHYSHHLENALAALAIGGTIGLPIENMLGVLKSFTGLPHRCQLVSHHQGVAWYNDSKGTNVGATIAAIISLGLSKKNSLILIAGGDAKKADLTPLINPITTYVDRLILLGQDAPLFYQMLNQKVPCLQVNSMSAAVLAANQLANEGDIVLLSPACASFDMFNNYEHRGNVFTQCVQGLV